VMLMALRHRLIAVIRPGGAASGRRVRAYRRALERSGDRPVALPSAHESSREGCAERSWVAKDQLAA